MCVNLKKREAWCVCEFEEEGGMVCVQPQKRGRKLGYVCDLKKEERS